MVLNTIGKIVVGAAILGGAAGAYGASDKVVIDALKKQDSSLSEKEAKKNLKNLSKDNRAKLEDDLGLSDAKKSDKKEGGDGCKSLITEPTADLASVLASYTSAAKLDDSKKIIDSLEAHKESLYKSPVLDSLDKTIVDFSIEINKTKERSSDIIYNLTKARDELAKLSESPGYRKTADGMVAFRKVAKLLGYEVPEDLKGAFSPRDKVYTKQIQSKQNAKQDGIPGPQTSVKLREEVTAKITDYNNNANGQVTTLEGLMTEATVSRDKAKADFETKNREAFKAIDGSMAKEYFDASKSIYSQLQTEVKTGKRKDVIEDLLTSAIGLGESAVKATTNPGYEGWLAKMKRWEADFKEDCNKLPPAETEIDTTKAVKNIENFTGSGLSVGSAAPYISVRNKTMMPSNTFIEFPLTGATVDLTGIGNSTELGVRVPFDSARSAAFVGDIAYRTQNTLAKIRSGNKIGDMTSDEFTMRGGVEGRISKLGVNGLSFGYKAMLGLINYNQIVERTNEPGIKRELDRESVQTLLELALKYGGSKNFQIGLNAGYNSVNQTKESTRGGPAGAIGTEATDYTREFSGSMPIELLLGKLNILAEPEVSLRTYSYLEDALSGRDLGYGCGGLISFDKVAVGGRGFMYPEGYRGDAFVHIAPFKAPVQLIGTFGMDRLNSNTVDVKKNTENYEVGLGLLIGETLGGFYNRLKENKPKVQKE